MKNTLNNLAFYTSLFVAGFASLHGSQALGQCTVVNDLTIPTTYLSSGFNGNGNFNAVVLGNFSTGDGSVEGKVAVGGNFNLNSTTTGYQVGLGAATPATGDNFIVNGTLTHNTGNDINVRGNFYYGSVEGSTPLPIHATGEGSNINQTGRIDFVGLKQHFIDLSDNYETQAATALPDPIVSASNIVLTGDNTLKNYVFNISLSGNTIAGVTFVDIPVGSGILINIVNPFVNITGSGPAMVADYKASTLFNFPNATTILLNSFSLQGGLLAPNANLSALSSSEIVGPVVIGGNINQAQGLSIKNSCLDYSLPVTLVNFKARGEGAIANLTWQTSSESNSDKFVIERSGDNKKWELLGEVFAKGDSEKSNSYYFTDKQPVNGSNLYRLKMKDKNGSFAYSSIVSVSFQLEPGISAFPNPATSRITFNAADWQKISSVQVFNQAGKSQIAKTDNGKAIDVTNLPQGLYFLKITEKNGNVSTQKIVKK
jgi:choice-of-anchor A domain-containing protein